MEEEDKEFFILVLGVLAAIILVVSWWFTTGGITAPAVQTSNAASAASTNDSDDHGEDEDEDEDEQDDAPDAADAGEPTETEPAAEPEPVDPEEADDGADEAASAAPLPATVFDAIAANDDLSVVQDLLRDNGLDAVLSGDGPFTVFAPSNEAISTAVGSESTAVVLENDIATVLTYHVVPGSYTVDELTELVESQSAGSAELTTVQGEPVTLTLDSGILRVNGSTAVQPDSVPTDNGVLHTLDNVLVPPVAALNTLVGLDPILFTSGSADIQAESFATLDQFIEVLNASSVDVTIEGHTDSSGDAILNQNLSQSRARSVLNYLVANGVDESRLSAQGFGPDRPVADNDTEEGRALNRRIEFALG